MLLSAVRNKHANSYYSEVFIFNKRLTRLAGLRLDEVKSAQRELMQYPQDLIEYGRLELKKVNGGCQYKLTAV